MLQAMQQPAEIPPSPNFAGLLASLAAPAHKSASDWSSERADDGLEDDFATLSYERALRAHARYRTAGPTDQSLTQAADPDFFPPPTDVHKPTPETQRTAPTSRQPETVSSPTTLSERNLKCASVTIRLSQAECAQLRTRAAEAGLTVSAYLRSCTFEAESLRAMVKDTLARLRTGAPAEEPAVSAPPRRSWLSWAARLLPVGHGGQRAASA
jgi:predicted DNA binding CopG/RHH family protein